MTNKKIRRERKALAMLDQRNADIKTAHRMPIPKILRLGVTPDRICRAYDVYFNDEKQLLCTIADVEKGYIVRYKCGVGRRGFGTETEKLFGKVEIRRKGETKRREIEVAGSEPVGTTCVIPERSDSGITSGATYSPPVVTG